MLKSSYAVRGTSASPTCCGGAPVCPYAKSTWILLGLEGLLKNLRMNLSVIWPEVEAQWVTTCFGVSWTRNCSWVPGVIPRIAPAQPPVGMARNNKL